jgi:hypothetical protein
MDGALMEGALMETLAEQKVWDAWVLKGKLQDKAAARKYRIVAGFFLVLLAIAVAYYFGAVK